MVASLCQVPCLSKHLGLYTEEYHIVAKFVLKSHLIHHCNTFDFKIKILSKWIEKWLYIRFHSKTYEQSCSGTFKTCLQKLEGGLLPFVSVLVYHKLKILWIILNNEFAEVAELKLTSCENSSAKVRCLCPLGHWAMPNELNTTSKQTQLYCDIIAKE